MLLESLWEPVIPNSTMILPAHTSQWCVFGAFSREISSPIGLKSSKFLYEFVYLELCELSELSSQKTISVCCGYVYWGGLAL